MANFFKIYLDALGNEGPFYRRPLAGSSPRYGSQLVGVNKLNSMMKVICEKDISLKIAEKIKYFVNDVHLFQNYGMSKNFLNFLIGFERQVPCLDSVWQNRVNAASMRQKTVLILPIIFCQGFQ